MVEDSDTLVAFARFIRQQNPAALKIFQSVTEQEFIEGVEEALERALDTLESARSQYQALGELALSTIIVSNLNAACVPTTAEQYVNGHVDIVISHPAGKIFCYLGECKIWDGVAYHLKGLRQLLERYATGRHRRGCCIEFIKIPNFIGKLKELRVHLDSELPLNQEGRAETHPAIKGSFVTRHLHSSGLIVEVLHLGCNLHQPDVYPKT